jgi:hypothetical protein
MPRGRKPSLTAPVKTFSAELSRARNVLLGQPPTASKSVRDSTAEDAFFRAAVALESFMSEWVVRAIAIDPSVLQDWLENRVEKEAQRYLRSEWEHRKRLWSPFASNARLTVTISLPVREALDRVRVILDCDGDNLSFRNSTELHAKTNDWLAPNFNATIAAFSSENNITFDVARAIRNVIAHRTIRAVDEMNRTLRSTKLPLELRRDRAYRVTAGGVGAYLNATLPTGTRRCDRYFDLFKDIGARF